MPRFTTISPTHIPGKKEYAWQKFLEGGYVAIGWSGTPDFTGKSFDEIERIIRSKKYANETSAIESFRKFLELEIGDYIAVNNGNHGLFGVGTIASGYKFQEHRHDTGAESRDEFYSHYREVKWLVTEYTPRLSLMTEGETGWQPYGTMGKLYGELPPYIQRLLGIRPSGPEKGIVIIRPDFLESVIQSIEILRRDLQHQERDHESLVEDFFIALGYQKHKDIKFRRGRVDVTLSEGQPLAIVEVKRSWDLSPDNRDGLDAVKQAYAYAHDKGVRYVIVTNGDTYLFYDRLKGLSWEKNRLGVFSLTSLQADDLEIVERLRPQRLSKPDLGELFQHLSETFR